MKMQPDGGQYLTSVSDDRRAHWIKLNHQNRVPKRWISFDTESRSTHLGDTEYQAWRMGAAFRWRLGLRTGIHLEQGTFTDPMEMWSWVRDHCKSGQRTVAVCHNLAYDVRTSRMLECLPQLGYELEWCNLDRNVSAMTWRSDHGTLILADLWTWLPMPLASIAKMTGTRKLSMPSQNASGLKWEQYCLRDAEIVHLAMKELTDYIDAEKLGNWQPTGAGMAYATWRHKFMTHKMLVHDDVDALSAERSAMHTGRAEAWRHGQLEGDVWTEVDLTNAYLQIAADSKVPVKYKYTTPSLTLSQYDQLQNTYRMLALCYVQTNNPVVPCRHEGRTLWPVGRFVTWLWDTEIDALLESGATVRLGTTHIYTKGYALQEWAEWVLSLLDPRNESVSPVVRTWAKHCARALIGRISLRSPRWEVYGDNPSGDIGISYLTDLDTGLTHRMMHVGNRTLLETDRQEGKDSLPQVTGWIMAECRRRLWHGLKTAGEANVAHVDTDSLLVNQAGLRRLRAAYGTAFRQMWHLKGSYKKVTVYGPRNWRGDNIRKASGVPRKAEEILPNLFRGERWHGVARDIEAGRYAYVTIETGTWPLSAKDPRRQDAIGGQTLTRPYQLDAAPTSGVSISPKSGAGS